MENLKKKINLAIRSRAVWTIIVIFVFNGLQAIEPMVSSQSQVLVNTILSAMASIFKVVPSQDYTE